MILYSQRLLSPLIKLGDGVIEYKNINPILNKLYKTINEEEIINCANDSIKTINNISFANVMFSYDENKKILQNFNFNFNKGSINGIIGDNGSGKSTIFRLIRKLVKPNSGMIKINGKDINSFSIDELSDKISVMPQNSMLSYLDLENLNKNAHKIKKIFNLPEFNVLSTKLKVQNFSNGEIQKIAFIKTILEDKEIILFDEPTSALDINTEKEISRVINSMCNNKIIFIITHRQYLLDICDEIISIN